MKQVFYKLLIIPFLLFAASSPVFAQNSNPAQNALDSHHVSRSNEKLFVHSDKGLYLTGELIWFKVYAVDAGNFKKASLSKVAYIDIIDDSNKAVVQAKVELNEGKGNGSVYIPVTAASGTYTLRAYTSWMKNFKAELYFEKPITIVNPLKSGDAIAEKSLSYDIQFFPEGGDLIAGIPGTVAFKATGKDGKGINLNGVIVNQDNDTLSYFQTLKFGMGRFSFTPVANNSYRAIIRSGQNDIRISPLPPIKERGFAISVKEAGSDELDVQVRSNLSDQETNLVIHNGRQVSLARSAPFNAGTAQFRIKKSELADGISQFTVFNKSWEPFAERLYFKVPSKKMQIDAGTDAGRYATRRPVSVSVNTKSDSGSLLPANLSVSVYRTDSLYTAEDINILNHLWLGSEIKGYIESPDYYFLNDNSGSREALDNLLLTQGWRRFNWEEAFSKKPVPTRFLPELQGHLLSGKVTGTNGEPIANRITHLGIPGKRIQYYAALSDSTGRFYYNTRDLYGPSEIVMQSGGNEDGSYTVVESPFSEQYFSSSYPAFRYSASMLRSLEESYLGVQVQHIYAADKYARFYKPAADSSAFYGSPSKSYLLDDYTRFTTMEEVIREYITEVTVLRQQRSLHLKVLSETGLLENDPLVLLDGVPFLNTDSVLAIDPLKIKRLDIVQNRYYYGPLIADGILNFVSYDNDLGGSPIDPRAIVINYDGMQLQREYYSPVYDSPQAASSRIPDFRNVIYWSPDLNTDSSGKGSFKFYTSDRTGSYIGVIQGLSKDGIPGSNTFRFEVTK